MKAFKTFVVLFYTLLALVLSIIPFVFGFFYYWVKIGFNAGVQANELIDEKCVMHLEEINKD